MNNYQSSIEHSLHIPPLMWQAFRKAMLEVRISNEEVIGFLFCQRHPLTKHVMRYIPRVWVVPSTDCYEYQSTDGLVLKQSFHLYLLKTYLYEKGYHLVHIHTHVSQTIPNFSSIDDRYESDYANFLTTHLPSKPRFISGVFDQSLQQGQFRVWNRKGKSYQPITCDRSWLKANFNTKWQDSNFLSDDHKELMFSRQKIFGQLYQQQLEQITVTLIGCGGIGAIFAELLGRLGVKKWILIDPDKLETTNLNRMPAATPKMVEQQWYKVHYVKGLIKKIYLTETHVKALPTAIENTSLHREIAISDLIVVATDNHHSRQIAQELAIAYMRPLVCLGTHIDIQPDHLPRMYCRITIPPLGGNWCLMCGNMINLQQAALEIAPSDIHHLVEQEGYLESIQDPAVFWLNSICASTAVGIIQGIMTGFINIDSGVDWIYEFPSSKWLKTDVSYLYTPNCYFCGEENQANTLVDS